jgi:hypothetical protein
MPASIAAVNKGQIPGRTTHPIMTPGAGRASAAAQLDAHASPASGAAPDPEAA